MNRRDILFILRFSNLASRPIRAAATSLRGLATAAGTTATRGVSKLNVALARLGTTMKSVGRRTRRFGLLMREVGTNLTVGLSVPIGLAAGAVVMAAAKMELAMAGVQKTVKNLTDNELAELERTLMDVSETVPISARALAKVAQLGGQLGIPKESLKSFALLNAKMAASTDLTEESSAVLLARFRAASKSSVEDIDNIAAALVALGNTYEVFERETLDIAGRMAQTGQLLVDGGMAPSDFLAYATAARRLNLGVQRSGTAMSKFFMTLNAAASGSTKHLAAFAKGAGMSMGRFGKLLKDDVNAAITAYLTNMAKMGKENKNTIQIMQDLGFQGDRAGSVILGLGQSIEKVAEIRAHSAAEFEKAIALEREYDIFKKTQINRMKTLINVIHNAAASLGKAFKPQIEALIERFKIFAFWLKGTVKRLGELGDKTKNTIVKVVLLAAAIGPVVATLGIFTAIMGSAIGALSFAAAGFTVLARTMMSLVIAAFMAVVKANLFLAKVLSTVLLVAVRGAIAALKILGKTMWRVFVLSPIGAGIAAVVIGLGTFAAVMRKLRGESVDFASVIGDVVNGVIRAFLVLVEGTGFAMSAVVTAVTSARDQVAKEWKALAAAGKAAWEGEWSKAWEIVSDPKLGSFDEAFGNSMDMQVEELKRKLLEIATTDYAGILKGNLGDLAGRAGGLLGDLDFSDVDLSALVSRFQAETGTALDGIRGGFEEWWSQFSDWFKVNMPGKVKEAVEDATTEVKDVDNVAPTFWGQFWADTKESALQGMSELSTALKDSKVFEGAFDSGIDALSEFIQTGKNGFREWALEAVTQIQKVILKLLLLKAINTAGEMLSTTKSGDARTGWAGAIGGALTSFAGAAGGFNMGGQVRAMSLMHARRFQHGGEVLGPPGTDNVPALLTPGERVLTRSEAREYERGPRGSTNVTVNINGVSDFQSFRQNKGELQAAMAQALARANVRNN